MWHNLSHVHCAPQAHPSRSLPLQPRHATALTLPVRRETPHQPFANQPLSSQPWPRLRPHRFAALQAARFKPGCLGVAVSSEGLQLLGNGNAGPLVESLQRQLSDAGYPVEPDGIFGPKTEAAVRAFQTAHGLQIDGIAGPETSGRLLELMAIPMPGSAATAVPELELTPMVSNPALNAASEILMVNTEAGLPDLRGPSPGG